MPKTIALALSAFMAFANVVLSEERPRTSAEYLRALVYAGDIDGVEAALDDAQSALDAGDLDADAMRGLFDVFAVTHPDVISFTKDWLHARPSSPYAQSARAIVLFEAGWIVRGSNYARDTHPEAMARHSELHRMALDLARAAHATNERMIAASDVIVMLANTGGAKDFSFEVFDRTMKQMPNWGTLTRAFAFGHPGYGGSLFIGEALCDRYAPLVDIRGEDAVSYCKIQFLVEQRTYKNWPAMALALLDTLDPNPWLEQYRVIAQLNNHPMDPVAAEAVRAHVEVHGLASLYWADYYDLNVALRWNFEPQAEKTLKRVKAEALAALQHDPYNPELLDTLMRPSQEIRQVEVVKDGKTRIRTGYFPIENAPSPEDELDYMQRKVAAAPYDAEHWRQLATLLRVQSVHARRQLADLVRWDGYWQNSIYYGMHRIDHLESFAHTKILQLALYTEALAADGQANGWADDLEAIDRDADLVCPIVRLGLVMEAVRAFEGRVLSFDPALQAVVDDLTAEVAAKTSCPGLLEADVEDLAYGPVPLDVLGQESPFSEDLF